MSKINLKKSYSFPHGPFSVRVPVRISAVVVIPIAHCRSVVRAVDNFDLWVETGVPALANVAIFAGADGQGMNHDDTNEFLIKKI